MSGVEFDTDTQAMMQKMRAFNNGGNTQGVKGMAGWLIRKGIVSSESSAQKVMLAIVAVNIIITIAIIVYIL
jgi:hypothetical protein